MSAPRPLRENAGLAFLGEAPWPPAVLTEREANRLLAVPNPCGRPNADVLRRRLAVVNGEPAEGWQLDFPAHFTAQEVALYEQPCAWLRGRSTGAWLNPHAQPGLRRALARVSRWLAMPAAAAIPDWRWIEDDLLPDATLLVVARDDDFTHGVLSSRTFALWWQQHRKQAVLTVESFPFPWPPGTALSALTKAQEEQRHAIARAARAGSMLQLNEAVTAAYGWSLECADNEHLERLVVLNNQRDG